MKFADNTLKRIPNRIVKAAYFYIFQFLRNM